VSIKMKVDEQDIIFESIGNLLAHGKNLEAYETLVTAVAAYIGTVLDLGSQNGYTEKTGKPVPTLKRMVEGFAEDVLMHAEVVTELEKKEGASNE
jgi:hypothetical protein